MCLAISLIISSTPFIHISLFRIRSLKKTSNMDLSITMFRFQARYLDWQNILTVEFSLHTSSLNMPIHKLSNLELFVWRVHMSDYLCLSEFHEQGMYVSLSDFDLFIPALNHSLVSCSVCSFYDNNLYSTSLLRRMLSFFKTFT